MQRDAFQIKSFPSLPAFANEQPRGRPLRICIATEEIFGPVRNGGIASTYYHLARMLADDGHSVTVLYLKGTQCENRTAAHWIDFYRSLAIRFVPLPAASVELICPSPRWQRSMYELYLWLRSEEPYDIVHTSEWRGGAYYALLAKRLRLAFEHTLFLVKASSPWIWNRHYRMLPLGRKAELARMYPERRVVELADIVIGGSAHLLTFMEQKGYRLPVGRTFVQPNIIDLQDLDVEEKRSRYEYGDRVKTGELVFFGRLESRKGLDIFCEAISRLLERGVQPLGVTFLGKKGERLPAHPDMTSLEFIRFQARAWPCPVSIIDSYDQDKAIEYLCASPRIAVMPSVIENSSMTVYECLVHRIPFLASAVGGTRELISEHYHHRVLIEPHPEPLADALQEVLSEGGTVAEGAFDYLENLHAWRDFHRGLAVTLDKKTARQIVAVMESGSQEQDPLSQSAHDCEARYPASLPEEDFSTSWAEPGVSVCIYHHRRPGFLERLLDSLRPQKQGIDEIIIVNDGPQSDTSRTIRNHMEKHFASLTWRVIDQPHRCIGSALNAAARWASKDLLVFLNAERHYCKPDLIDVLRRAAKHSPAVAFTFFHSFFEDEEALRHSEDRECAAPLGGDLATGFYEDGVFGGSCFAVRRGAFHALGGLYEAYHLGGVEQEFQARLLIAGHDLDVVPEVLYRERRVAPLTAFNQKSKEYLAIRPYLLNAPYYMENIILAARMLARRVDQAEARSHAKRMRAALRRRDREAAGTLWTRLRRTFPEKAKGFVRGAVALARAGRPVEAEEVRGLSPCPPDSPGGRREMPADGASATRAATALPASRPLRAASAMALKRCKSRFGVGKLEASLLLDPAWLASVRSRHGSAAACVLRRNGRLAARVPLGHGSEIAVRVTTKLRSPLFVDVLYTVHDAFSEDVLGAVTSPALQRARRIKGAVRSRAQPEVCGWVLDPGNPERGRRVSIHVDGVLLDVVDATTRHEEGPGGDGPGGGRGFVWPIPDALASKNGTLIEIFDAGTGRPLSGSPVRIESGRVIATKGGVLPA